MAARLEKLELRKFRGATQPVTLEFDPSKPVVVIFGENGSGKSTLVDAIDFVCNNDFGSLSERSSTKPASHIMSQGATIKDLEVALTVSGVKWTGKLASGKAQSQGPAGTTKPGVMILRRSNITQIMDLPPGKKYNLVKEFIVLPRLEAAEASLRDTSKAINADLDRDVQAFDQARDTLDSLWQGEGRPQGDLRAWANRLASQDVSALEQQVQQASELLQLYQDAAAARERLAAANATALTQRAQLDAAQSALDGAERGQAGGSRLVGLLEEAQAYLKANTAIDACPVCGEPKTATGLLERVSGELAALRSLAALRATREQAATAARHADSGAASLRRVYLDQARQLATTVSAGPALPGQGEAARLRTAGDEAAATAAADQLLAALQPAVAGLTQLRDDDRKALNLHNTVVTLANTVTDKQNAAKQSEALAQRLEAMVDVVARQRKAHIETVLATIAGTVDDLYQRIHPGEPLGQLKMSLKANTIGSLEMSAAFGAQADVPPVAYYSDSHLDTLGLCVYLALARHNNTDTFIVLDDVLMSVDDMHQERIIRVLHEEAVHFGQVIITTHLRSWRDRYRLGRAAANQVQLLELHSGWTPDRGLQLSKTSLSTDDLRTALAQTPMDRQGVASKAGVLGESLLDWMALQYRRPVPRQAEPNYALSDLLGAFDGKFRKLMRVERLDAAGAVQITIALQPLLDDLDTVAYVRNQVGAHFNAAGLAVPDSDVRKLAEATLALAEALACPVCGAIPSKDKSGSYLECAHPCGKTRLHPLKPPA